MLFHKKSWDKSAERERVKERKRREKSLSNKFLKKEKQLQKNQKTIKETRDRRKSGDKEIEEGSSGSSILPVVPPYLLENQKQDNYHPKYQNLVDYV